MNQDFNVNVNDDFSKTNNNISMNENSIEKNIVSKENSMKPKFDLVYNEKIIALIISIVILIVVIITWSVKNHPNDSSYMLLQILKQSSLIYLVLQITLVIIYFKYNELDKTKTSYILLVVAIILSYCLSVFMGYAITSECKYPKRYSIFMNSLIVPISIVGIFLLVTNIEFMRSGFYYALNSTNESYIANLVAISFWMAMIIFPALTVTYFRLEEKACNTDIIEIHKIPQK